MKIMKKGTTMAMAFALSMAVATPFAVAQTPSTDGATQGESAKEWRKGDKAGKRRGKRAGRMFAGLELSDAQKAQLQQLRANHREALRPLAEQVRAKRQEVRELTAAGTVDEAAVRQKLVEAAGIQAKLVVERARLRQEVLAVLTPEQRTQLEQRREQLKNRRTERRERRNVQNAV